LKGLSMGGIKVEKIKSWIVGGSLFDQFNLCVVGAITLLLLCTYTVHLRAPSKTTTPRFLISWSSQHIDTPPQSEYVIYILVLLVMINAIQP